MFFGHSPPASIKYVMMVKGISCRKWPSETAAQTFSRTSGRVDDMVKVKKSQTP
jgi:hypothetical protein